MTGQEIFDRAVCGVIAQGGPSSGQDGPRYRSSDGRRCAAGHVLPEEAHSDTLEGLDARSGRVTRALRGAGVDDVGLALVDRLQYLHDELAKLDIDDDNFLRRFYDAAAWEACRRGMSTKAIDAAIEVARG